MLSLRELQRAIRSSMVAQDDLAAATHVVGDGIAPMQRFAVYRNTFDGNLANALRLSYPAVHRLVGADFFEGAARIFAHQHPPRSAWLDEYGIEFSEFLKYFPPAATLAYLPDVARLEWAVTRALHSHDCEPLDANRLTAVDPALHERIRFVAHPSITLLRTEHPVDLIWRAVLGGDDAALSGVDLAAGPVRLLVQRRATGVEVTRLDEPAWQITYALLASQPLGTALGCADASTASNVLADHLAAGRFVAFGLSESGDAAFTSEIAA